MLYITCRIRPAVESDLLKLEWGGQYRHFRKLMRQTFDEHRVGRRLMLVADVNGYPIGQVFIQFVSSDTIFADGRERGYLYSLRVMEPFQRHRIGTRLVEAAERALRARGYSWSVIAASKDNPGARRLYERLGYAVFLEDPGQWQYTDHEGNIQTVVEPCWVMEKRLVGVRATSVVSRQ
jgi:ribosomal protein S18 acetylase RimI-like enzyme